LALGKTRGGAGGQPSSSRTTSWLRDGGKSRSAIRLAGHGIAIACIAAVFTVSASAAPDATAAVFTSTLVNTVDMAAFAKPSPDPSGLTYLPASNTLLMTDGEIEEVVEGITHFQGANLWELTLGGSVVRTSNVSHVEPLVFPLSDEPAGVAVKPSSGHCFVSDDSQKQVYDIDPGTDGACGTSDDSSTLFSTLAVGNTDPGGIAYDAWNDRLFIADGANSEIYQYTTAGALVAQFDVEQYGALDPESVEFNPVSGTLFVLSNRQSGPIIVETTTSGALLQTIDVSVTGANRPSGLAYAPASTGSGQHFYILDRGIDNNSDPNIVDGKMFELTAPVPTPPVNAPPVVGAGPNLSVGLPAAASLDGSATDDGKPAPPSISATWSQISGPSIVNFANPNAADTTASVSIPGTYGVRLTASDGEFTVSDEATLTFTGSASVSFLDVPVAVSSDDAEQLASTNGIRLANADLDLMIDAGGSNNVAVGLRFAGLGIPQGAAITHAYVQFEANTPSSVATALTLKGQAADNAPTFASQNSNITLRPTTTALATWSPDSWLLLGESSLRQRTPNLAGVVQEVVDRPGWASSNAVVLVITGSGQRSAEAWDSNPAAAPLLHVEWTTGGNQPPSVSAGSDQTITLPAGASLDGTVTDDGGPAPLATTWSQISGPGTATFADASAVDTSATFPQAGTYGLRLTAFDGELTSVDELIVTVNPAAGNQPPLVSAGVDQTVTLPAVANLDGTVSDDGLPAPPALTTTWSMTSGPGAVTFGNASLVDTTATFSQAGTYVLRLTASDGVFSPFDELTVTVNPASAGSPLYFSVLDVATVGGVTAENEDVVYFDGTTFNLAFDGSDVGLAAFRIDAFARLDAMNLLLSFDTAGTVPGIAGTTDDSDIVRFSATSLGIDTAGTFSMYFDGSDVLLTAGSEDVDAIELLPDGHILVSTTGAFAVTGVSGEDKDLLEFAPTTLGPVTAGTFTLYFDGSDVGLTTSGEDIDAAAVDSSGKIYLSTLNNFAVAGIGGADEDVFGFTPSSLGDVTAGTYSPALYFDGSVYGLAANDVTAVDLP